MNTVIEAPVLLIVFNRPETTQRVFDAVKKAAPKKLFISADAPRNESAEDEKNCRTVKEIVNNVDWPCDVHYKLAETNQGCGAGPYNAISWVFETEDRAIILEDDCVPGQAFFSFCDDLLDRYLFDNRIWVISGNQYNEEAVRTPHSYFFSRYATTWGWATWKRSWNSMDMNMSKYPLIINQDLFKAVFRTKKEVNLFRKKFDEFWFDESMRSHIWDYQWAFAVFSNGGLCILPSKNLVTNVGYLGTHSQNKNRFHDINIDEKYRISSHPDFILCDVNYDTYHFNHHWNKKTSFLKKVVRTIGKHLC
jgi:hypothetical protein